MNSQHFVHVCVGWYFPAKTDVSIVDHLSRHDRVLRSLRADQRPSNVLTRTIWVLELIAHVSMALVQVLEVARVHHVAENTTLDVVNMAVRNAIDLTRL